MIVFDGHIEEQREKPWNCWLKLPNSSEIRPQMFWPSGLIELKALWFARLMIEGVLPLHHRTVAGLRRHLLRLFGLLISTRSWSSSVSSRPLLKFKRWTEKFQRRTLRWVGLNSLLNWWPDWRSKWESNSLNLIVKFVVWSLAVVQTLKKVSEVNGAKKRQLYLDEGVERKATEKRWSNCSIEMKPKYQI